MNTNNLKRRHVVSARNHRNKFDSKKIKSEENDQFRCSGNNKTPKGENFQRFAKIMLINVFKKKLYTVQIYL